MVVHAGRHAEPRMHRFLKDRVAGRRKCRCLERTHCNSADLGVAVPLPIEGGAATRTKMKSDAVAAVGIALVDLPLAVEPHPLFGIRRTEMESRAGAALASLAVAQINSIGFTRGNHSKRAAVALPDPFRCLLPTWYGRILTYPVGCCRAAFGRRRACRVIRKGRWSKRSP